MPVVDYTVVNGEILSENRAGVERDYVPDILGSTIALLDNSQTKTDTFTYWPYGEVKTRTGTTATPFQYVGTWGYYQDTSSRIYVRARVPDVVKGRWMTEDPIGFKGGDWNLYAYSQKNPITMSDPSGTDAICPPRGPCTPPQCKFSYEPPFPTHPGGSQESCGSASMGFTLSIGGTWGPVTGGISATITVTCVCTMTTYGWPKGKFVNVRVVPCIQTGQYTCTTTEPYYGWCASGGAPPTHTGQGPVYAWGAGSTIRCTGRGLRVTTLRCPPKPGTNPPFLGYVFKLYDIWSPDCRPKMPAPCKGQAVVGTG